MWFPQQIAGQVNKTAQFQIKSLGDTTHAGEITDAWLNLTCLALGFSLSSLGMWVWHCLTPSNRD